VIPQVVVKRERWPGAYRGKVVPLVDLRQEVAPYEPVLLLEQEEESGRVERKKDDLPVSVRSPSGRLDVQAKPTSGQDGQDESISAGLYGRVVGFTQRGGIVIESRVIHIRGLIGSGLQVAGTLTIWQPPHPDRVAQVIPPGAILVIPEPLTFALLHHAIRSGVVGIVASSIALRDLEGFLRTDVLQLLTTDNVELAQAHLPNLTLLCTEGVGSFHMPTYLLNVLRQYEGSVGLLTGRTSVRHAISPELVISLPAMEVSGEWPSPRPDPTLFLGVQVRVRGGEYKGMIGLLDYFFVHEQVLNSGIRGRAVRLRREDGAFCVVPLALIERIK
jgi:hypothetical protein